MLQRWPATFNTVRPLKLGIRDDLIAEGVSEEDADAFLGWYVQQPKYLAAQVRSRAQRYDLQGERCGPVSVENAAYAAGVLAWAPSALASAKMRKGHTRCSSR